MPNLTPPDHGTYQLWLHLEPDGELTRAELGALERHLEACAACRAERREIATLADRLAAAAVAADPALARNVMASLPPAGWEARNPRAWRPAAAVVALLAGTAILVAALSSGGGTAAAPAAGAARAVLDLLLATAVAGAGLLTASWQGLGLALGEIFGGSRLTLGVFALFVAGVDFLFVRYLLRQPGRALARRGRR